MSDPDDPTDAPAPAVAAEQPEAYEPLPAVEQPTSEPQSEPRSGRLPLVLATVAAVAVLATALAAPLIDRAIRGDAEVQRALDLTLVETWEITDRAHTVDDVTYPQDPPAGGAHARVWLACGTYDEPVRDENAVHDLEHGTVWITHDPDLSEDDVAALADQLPANGILSPRDALPSPVVVTVWGVQLQLDSADDRRLGLFLEEYGDGHTAPEFGASCEGGTPDPTGALPEPGTNA